ncbi:hypothetical protein [Curtobacterium sp. MCPF17_052]|uniref:hypothetical protein n=1 Tax=Curtobacterium sp. MCPF17_052 TaxID=2175655 RepID=UPI003464A9F7
MPSQIQATGGRFWVRWGRRSCVSSSSRNVTSAVAAARGVDPEQQCGVVRGGGRELLLRDRDVAGGRLLQVPAELGGVLEPAGAVLHEGVQRDGVEGR